MQTGFILIGEEQLKFRPQQMPKVKMRNSGIYNYVNWRPYDTFVYRVFSQLHYLGSHSPLYTKWHKVEKKFINRYRRTEL
jgi:hypothetical protein